MASRIFILMLIVGGLLGLVAYSKWNPEPLRVSGMVEADEIRLGSRLGGRVAVVHVEEGGRALHLRGDSPDAQCLSIPKAHSRVD